MAKEYEHKYLLKGKPAFIFMDESPVFIYDIQLLGTSHIEQFYITINRDRSYVSRARYTKSSENSTVGLYEECHKIGKGKDTEEIEYYITEIIYNNLKEHCHIGNVISKIRHRGVDRYGYRWDIDKYSTGEWIAELENPPDDYIVPFEGAINVTDDFNYSNASIALNGFPKIS
jgi:CYTH domain-containing protein